MQFYHQGFPGLPGGIGPVGLTGPQGRKGEKVTADSINGSGSPCEVFISVKKIAVFIQGESADGLPGPPGRQGEPGNRVR